MKSYLKDFIDEKDVKEAFSSNLEELIKDHGKQKISECMNISERMIDKYRNNDALPNITAIFNLANQLNMPIESLISSNKKNLDFNMYSLVVQLGVLICKLSVTLPKDEENEKVSSISKLHLHIEDPKLSQILLSLYKAKKRLNKLKYYERVNELAERYASMQIYDKQLKDYEDYMDLIHQEYIYQTADDCIFYGTDDNGDSCMATDEYTSEEIDSLDNEWEQFNEKQKIRWANLNEKEKKELLNLTFQEKSVYLSQITINK